MALTINGIAVPIRHGGHEVRWERFETLQRTALGRLRSSDASRSGVARLHRVHTLRTEEYDNGGQDALVTSLLGQDVHILDGGVMGPLGFADCVLGGLEYDYGEGDVVRLDLSFIDVAGYEEPTQLFWAEDAGVLYLTDDPAEADYYWTETAGVLTLDDVDAGEFSTFKQGDEIFIVEG